MFKSEREMQDIFVNLLKKRKTCGLIFEEVGNRNFFFRTDIVEYKGRNNIISYELKLKNFNKVLQQAIFTLNIYDKTYVVIPEEMKCNFVRAYNNFENENKNKIGVMLLSRENYKILRTPSKESTRNFQDKFNVNLVADLIIRGYHKNGDNKCKSYK